MTPHTVQPWGARLEFSPGARAGQGSAGAGPGAERSQPVPPGWLDLGAMGSWRVSPSNRLALQRRQLRNVKILIKQVFKTSFQLRSILIDNHSNSSTAPTHKEGTKKHHISWASPGKQTQKDEHVVHSLSCVQLIAISRTAAHQAFSPPASPTICSNSYPLSR